MAARLIAEIEELPFEEVIKQQLGARIKYLFSTINLCLKQRELAAKPSNSSRVRYAIVSESDLGAGLDKLHALGTGTVSWTVGKNGRVRRFRRLP